MSMRSASIRARSVSEWPKPSDTLGHPLTLRALTRQGFTLIEIMAVVLLIGLLASAAAWSMSSAATSATRGEAIAKLKHADATARMAAKRLGGASLRLDLDTQRLVIITPDPATGEPRPGHTVRLPANYRMQQVQWMDTRPQGRVGLKAYETRVVENGVFELPYTGAGLGRTCVIRLVGPKAGETGQVDIKNAPSWLLISGLTGQVTEFEDEQAIDNMLRVLRVARPDPD